MFKRPAPQDPRTVERPAKRALAVKTINASTISSGLFGYVKKVKGKYKAEKMKLDCVLKQYSKYPGKKEFGDLQRCIYFPHGNLFETEAAMKFTELMGDFQRESKGGSWNDEEKLYAKLTKPFRYKVSGEPKTIGVNSKKTEDYHPNWNVSSRPDGYYDSTHVVEIKCPFGHLYKQYGSGKTATGWDPELEIFEIPTRYKIQMFIEMLCHKKRYGYFMQYYQPKGWYNFAQYLINLYKRDYEAGDFVYKPFYNVDDMMLTILYKPIRKFPKRKKQILDFYDRYMNPHRRRTDPTLATPYEKKHNIMLESNGTCLPFLPKNQSSQSKQEFQRHEATVKSFLRRLFDESSGSFTWNNQPLWSIFQNEFGADAEKIRQSFFTGSNMLKGTVQGVNNAIKVLWSNGITETMSHDQCRENIMGVLKMVSGMSQRKDNTDWWKWTKSIQQGVIQSLPTEVPYAEAVIHVLDLSECWETCNQYMKEFLDILTVVRTTGYTGEMIDFMEKMYGYFDSLESEVCMRKAYDGI